jgi:predicted DNA-binding protein|tara:strand:+ start:1296 stop:1457 length:162 start_codon:yes stop_codon:yes gene_type:complete
MSDLKPFLVRLTPQSVDLLAKASKDQEKTKASLINEAIKSHLTSDLKSRLNRL